MPNTSAKRAPAVAVHLDDDTPVIEIPTSTVLPEKVTKSVGLGLSIAELALQFVGLFRRKPKA